MPVVVAAVFAVVVAVTVVAAAAVVAVDTEAVVSAVGTAVAVVEVVAGPALELEVLELVELFESVDYKTKHTWNEVSFTLEFRVYLSLAPK